MVTFAHLKEEPVKKNMLVIAAVAASAALASGGAAARGFYAGLAGGQSDQSIDCTGTTTCNNTGTSWKVYGGWQFLPFMSAELTYYSLGTAKSSTAISGASSTRLHPQAADSVDVSISGDYIGIGLAGRTNFSTQFGAVLRGGTTFTNGKVSATSTLGGGFSETRNSTLHAYLGLGADYALTDKVKLTLDYDHTRLAIKVTDPFGAAIKETHDVNLWAVGANMAF